MAAARIEHRLQLLDHEGNIAGAPEHGADHAGQSHGPGIVFHVLGVDENFEGAFAAILDDVVDGHIDGVLAFRPFQLVGVAFESLGPFQGLGHIDHAAGL